VRKRIKMRHVLAQSSEKNRAFYLKSESFIQILKRDQDIHACTHLFRGSNCLLFAIFAEIHIKIDV